MSIGTVLVIVAALLVIVGLAVGYGTDSGSPNLRHRRSYLMVGIAVLLICVALCIGVEPFVRT